MKIKFIVLWMCFLYPFIGFAQEDTIQLRDELNFIFHLGESKQIDDLEFYSNQLLNDTIAFTQDFRDFRGFCKWNFIR
jgi:hypothetical protein